MDPHSILETAVHGTELLLAIGAVISIIITQIITTRANSAKIQTLANHVKQQNGTLSEQAREMHAMQIVCAETHGVRQRVANKPIMPPDGDEP